MSKPKHPGFDPVWENWLSDERALRRYWQSLRDRNQV